MAKITCIGLNKKTLFNILPHKTEKGEQSKQGEQ